MRRPRPLPATLSDAFTVGEALTAGVTPDRLRTPDLARPFTGARSRVDPLGTRAQALALLPLLGPDQYFSHLTAAELHGMRLPEQRRRGLHLTHRHASRAMRRPLVIGHKSRMPIDVIRLSDGLPVSAPVDAWCECGAILGVDDLVIMADGLVSRRDALASLPDLGRAVRSRQGRRGAARLRLALDMVRPGSDSARETALRLLLVRAGFPEPKVNAPLLDRHGRVIAHGDLVWPTDRVIVEYDGRQHAEDRRQFAIDIRRLDDIAAAGYRVIRVDRELMSNPTDLYRRLRSALALARGRVSGSSGRNEPDERPLGRRVSGGW